MADNLVYMKSLVDKLNKARFAYEQQDTEIMSNKEYDSLYDELLSLERSMGVTLLDSPTQNVGYEVVSGLKTKAHATPMLSCDKTKSVDDLTDFVKGRPVRLSLKLDGLTVVITYNNGKLIEALTRGDGYVGEVVTHNAKMFSNLPETISFKGKLVLRGEAVISYSDFKQINSSLPIGTKPYENPRNLVSATVRAYDNSVVKKRNVRWICFKVVSAEGMTFDDFSDSMTKQLDWVQDLGFEQVFSILVGNNGPVRGFTGRSMKEWVDYYETGISTPTSELGELPSDGLVMIYDELAYGDSLGCTSKFPRDSIAFKWADDVEETYLRDIQWNTTRSGMIVPVAIFDPVRLEGTTVTRATLSNVSILRKLQLGIGDKITVYKANKIIPHVHENLTKSDTYVLPDKCPACGGDVLVYKDSDSGVQTMYCQNKQCSAKRIKQMSHFVSRRCMDIGILSDERITDLLSIGAIRNFSDFYNGRLSEPDIKASILELDGWGDRLYDAMIDNINESRIVSIDRFLNALDILLIGFTKSKLITEVFNDCTEWPDLSKSDLLSIDGIGENIAANFVKYFRDSEKLKVFSELVNLLDIRLTVRGTLLSDKKFCITGSLSEYDKRDDLVAVINNNGGTFVSSVSADTDYLICNKPSSSSKYKKAVQFNVPIITESEFNDMIGA